MKITVIADDREENEEFGCEYMLSKDVDDLQSLMYFFGQVSRAIGFTYVDKVGCVKSDNEECWSEF